jgi:putative colanic acid biosynthesis glycosyltransferase
MKILQINSVFSSGSTGRIVSNLHNKLKNNGYDSYVIYGRGKKTLKDNKVFKFGNNFSLFFHIVISRLFDIQGKGSILPTLRMINLIKKIKPDIIHLHNIHGYFLNYKLLFNFFEKNQNRIVWTFHDCWPITGHCTFFEFVNCQKWISGCNSCPLKKDYPSSFFIDNSKNNYKQKKFIFKKLNLTIVTPSIWLRNIIKNSFMNKYEVKVINNGIDLSIFKPTSSNLKNDLQFRNKKVILGVANIWDKRKGLDYFYKLSRILDDSYKIVLVGLSKSQIIKCPSNIIAFPKTKDVYELAKLYSMASVFFNPTLDDNFPTTNLESLACGTPVITFDTGGSVESISNETGLVHKKSSFENIKASIDYIIDKIHRDNCIKAAKAFSNDFRLNEYFDLYNVVYNK